MLAFFRLPQMELRRLEKSWLLTEVLFGLVRGERGKECINFLVNGFFGSFNIYVSLYFVLTNIM